MNSFKRRLITETEQRVIIPEKCWVKNDTSIRMWGSIDNEMKHVVWATVQEVAENFLKHGVIDIIKYHGDQVKMYRKAYREVYRNGRPVFAQHLEPYLWEDIELSEGMIKKLIAVEHLKLTGKTMGMLLDFACYFGKNLRMSI